MVSLKAKTRKKGFNREATRVRLFMALLITSNRRECFEERRSEDKCYDGENRLNFN